MNGKHHLKTILLMSYFLFSGCNHDCILLGFHNMCITFSSDDIEGIVPDKIIISGKKGFHLVATHSDIYSEENIRTIKWFNVGNRICIDAISDTYVISAFFKKSVATETLYLPEKRKNICSGGSHKFYIKF